jgi:hypothetical protein
VITAPLRKGAIELRNGFMRHRAILRAVAEIEMRLDAEKQRMRAGRCVGVKTAAVE